MEDGKKSKPTVCRHCQGRMTLITVKKYAGKWPATLTVAGLFSFVFLGGPLLGVPLLFAGIYMYATEMTINHCPECGYFYRVWLRGENSD